MPGAISCGNPLWRKTALSSWAKRATSSATRWSISWGPTPTATTARGWQFCTRPTIYKDGLAKFKRFAVRVWGIDPTGKSDEEVAAAGVEALADFIKEIGLPTTLRELGVDESIDLGIIAASCNVAPGSYGKMCHAEIAAIFSECR